MRLSVENINQASPYWVIPLDDMTFRFATKHGVIYRVGFYIGYIVYSGMIIRNDHPIYDRLLKAFESFTRQAPSRYQVQPK